MYSLILRANDRYAAHLMVVDRIRGVNHPLRWGHYDDGTVEIRSHRPLDDEWQAVELPPCGTTIRFQVDSQVRMSKGKKPDGRKNRVINLDYTKNLDWIERQLPEVGLQVLNVDFDPVFIQINRSRRKRTDERDQIRHPFTMSASRFRGIARIVDADVFEQVLASIPRSNPKTFGLGFILFQPMEP